jgi:hypothetical protein
MPAPVVRQDDVWVRREARDRVLAREQAKSSEAFRQRCFERQREGQELQQQRRAQSRIDFGAAQHAWKLAHSKERVERNRVRRESIAEIEKAREATRAEAKKAEAEQVENSRQLVGALHQRKQMQRVQQLERKLHQMRLTANQSWRREVDAEESTRQERMRAEREVAAIAMRAHVRDETEYATQVEQEARRRARVEIETNARRKAERERRRARMRAKEAERGRDANIHYLNTHGDRLHWNPPLFEHTLEDGDGRWPYPMPPPKEYIPGMNYDLLTYQA